MFLLALFVLATGMAMVQVVANPLISLLGSPRTDAQPADLRPSLQFARHHDLPLCRLDADPGRSIAKVAADQLGGAALDAYRTQESQAIVHTYLGLAIALGVVAGRGLGIQQPPQG